MTDTGKKTKIGRLTNEQADVLLATGFVEDVHNNGKISYKNAMYVAMHNRIEKGMTYVQAFDDMGLHSEWLGKERANACGKRDEQMAREGKLKTLDPSFYDGSVPSEKMALDKMSPEEQLAYMKARVNWLETVEKVKKIALSRYAENHMSSNRTTK